MKYLCVRQGSDEWRVARSGQITASRCKDACDTLKNGALSTRALGYAAQVAMERVAGVSCDDTYVNFAMRRGTELEPEARALYEVHSGNIAEDSGIYLTDDEWFSYSSDGVIGDDGLLEIKCPLSPLVVVTMWRDQDLSDYQHQMQMGLWITGRKWIDFVMYDPRLAPVGKHKFIKRVRRDEAFIEKMEADLMRFRRIVDDFEAALRKPSGAEIIQMQRTSPAFENLLARMKAARTLDEAVLILDEAMGLPHDQFNELVTLRGGLPLQV